MKKKVLLILVDGMRPDSIALCGSKVPEELYKHSYHSLNVKTVWPSMTLPCHFSLMHSVTPQRHGILSNTYVPQVHQIDGLFDVMAKAGYRCGFFYSWEELRDLSKPGSLDKQCYMHGENNSYKVPPFVTREACDYIKETQPELCFLYLGIVDEIGHKSGWMSQEYLDAVKLSFECIKQAMEAAGDDYITIVTADHGGHDRMHGLDIPEDMIIPLFIYDKSFDNKLIENATIMDIAPTVLKWFDLRQPADWDGKALEI